MADKERVHPEPQLVQQAGVHQLVGEVTKAIMDDVAAVLSLERADRFDRVLVDDDRVVAVGQ